MLKFWPKRSCPVVAYGAACAVSKDVLRSPVLLSRLLNNQRGAFSALCCSEKCHLADVCGSFFLLGHSHAYIFAHCYPRSPQLAVQTSLRSPLSFVYTHALCTPPRSYPPAPSPLTRSLTHSLPPLSPPPLFLSNTLTHAHALFGSKGSVAYKLAAVSLSGREWKDGGIALTAQSKSEPSLD